MLFKYHRIYISLLVFISLSAFACCKDDLKNDEKYAVSNQGFMIQALSLNDFWIAAGDVAVSKAENPDVKYYAERVKAEHIANGNKIKNLASQKGWTIPNELLRREQEDLERLAILSSLAFDKEFAKLMADSHQAALTLYQTVSAPMGIADNDLRIIAVDNLPTLKVRVQDAVDLKKSVNP